jgi:hypothetical protein
MRYRPLAIFVVMGMAIAGHLHFSHTLGSVDRSKLTIVTV